MFFVIMYLIFVLPITILYPTKVIHKKRIKKCGRVIVTSNHYSNLDPIIYDVKFTTKFRFMGKVELFKNWLSSAFFKGMGVYPVDREKVTPSVYKKTLKLLEKNKKVFIFPEGTRNKSGSEEMAGIKSGVITFASKGEARILPMLMYRPPKIFRKNYIIVGEPFELEAENTKRLTKEELQHNLERYENALSKLREEIDEFVLSKKSKKNK